MPRDVPLASILAVRQRQARSTQRNAAAEEARRETDSPYFRLKAAREARQWVQEGERIRIDGEIVDESGLPTPRTNGTVAPRPSPRQLEESNELLLPYIPTRASAAAAAALDTVHYHGRVPTDLLNLRQLLALLLSRAARKAGKSNDYSRGLQVMLEAAGEAVAAANASGALTSRERPEVSLPPGKPEEGAVRRAAKKRRQAEADMKALREACERHSADARVQLAMGLLGWSVGYGMKDFYFNQEQIGMCLRWLAWLEVGQKPLAPVNMSRLRRAMPPSSVPSNASPRSPRSPRVQQLQQAPRSLKAVRVMDMDTVEAVLFYMRHMKVGRTWQTRALDKIAKEDPWVAHSYASTDGGVSSKGQPIQKGDVTGVDMDRLLLRWTQQWGGWDRDMVWRRRIHNAGLGVGLTHTDYTEDVDTASEVREGWRSMEKHRQKRQVVVAAATGGSIQRGSTFDDVVISAMAAKVTHAQSVVLPQRDGGGGAIAPVSDLDVDEHASGRVAGLVQVGREPNRAEEPTVTGEVVVPRLQVASTSGIRSENPILT